jgi:hypothetical protein
MKKIPGIIISKLFGIMIFFVVLYVLTRLSINNPTYDRWVNFLDVNATLIVMISLVMMVGEIFFALMFPFNTPGPLFNAFGALLITKFIFRIFSLVDHLADTNLSMIFVPASFIIYPMVFVIVLIGGYATIFARLVKRTEDKRVINNRVKKDRSWEEIGDDFKKAFGKLLRKIADEIDKK